MHSFAGAKMKKDTGNYIEEFGEDIHHYHQLLEEAFQGVIQEDISKYPVFIFHRQEVNVGLMIVDHHVAAGNWSVNISTLEEFYIKGLVSIEKAEEIKAKITGNPPQYCCLVLSGEKGSIVFIPRHQHHHQ
jgi:hypothetical protein